MVLRMSVNKALQDFPNEMKKIPGHILKQLKSDSRYMVKLLIKGNIVESLEVGYMDDSWVIE